MHYLMNNALKLLVVYELFWVSSLKDYHKH